MSVNKVKKAKKSFLRNERGQGMVEYILLLVIVLAIAGLFKNKIMGFIETKTKNVGDGINSFDGSSQ